VESNLKRINGLLKHENAKLKKWIEDMKKSDDTRRAVITEMGRWKTFSFASEQRDSES